ncbi:HsdS Restriction endonuclease S subunits [Sphingobium cupriresistens]
MFTDNPDDIPLVKGENIGQGEILWDKSRYWPATQFEEYAKLVLKPDDIVLAMDRPWVTAGLKYAIISDRDPISLLVQRVARIRPLPHTDAKFLKHIIGSKSFSEYIKGIMGGTNVPHISGRQIRDFQCQFPDLETQQRIASILSAYDDLIENNRRRIALLEEAARQLYKEWFVRFRFPGHEHVRIIDGVPEGWERQQISNLVTKLGSGATPRGGEAAYKESGITLVRSQNVYDHAFDDDGLAFIDKEQAKKLANVTVQSQDVLLNITGASVGRCCMVPDRHLPARVNQHVMIVRAKPELCSPFYLLFAINQRNNKEGLLSIARSGGATREALTKDDVGGFQILLSDSKLMNEFDEVAAPVLRQSHRLSAMNAELRRARDLLLPKLMSGAIAV